jgi:hypothetical protein
MFLSAAKSLQDFLESDLLVLVEEEAHTGLRARYVQLDS